MPRSPRQMRKELQETVSEQVRDLPIHAVRLAMFGVGRALLLSDRVTRDYKDLRESGPGPVLNRLKDDAEHLAGKVVSVVSGGRSNGHEAAAPVQEPPVARPPRKVNSSLAASPPENGEISIGKPKPTPKATSNSTPKATPKPTPKATSSSTPKATSSSTPKATSTSTPKATSTSTPKATSTSTPKPTPKATPNSTPKATPEPTPKPTPKPTAKATPTPTPTSKAAPKPTAKASPKPTAKPVVEPIVTEATETVQAEHAAPVHAEAADAVHAEPAAPPVPMKAAPLPVPDYGTATLASVRARLRALSADQVEELLAYEKAHQARADFVRMYENRIAKLAERP